MKKGSFIVFEGGEAAGKSLQARKLYEYLVAQGKSVIVTREPGGSPTAEKIRSLIFSDTDEKISVETETLLMFAARRDHLEKTIMPALAAEKIVICDRFLDSTYVYQSALGGLEKTMIDRLAEMFVPVKPDLTLFLDVSAAVSAARLQHREQAERNRYDEKTLAEFETLRNAWQKRAAESGAVTINAEGDIEDIFHEIVKKCLNFIKL